MHSLWSMAVAGLGLGSLSIVGGTAIGGEFGPLAAGYGVLIVLAALYLVIGLAIRQRVWRHIGVPMRAAPPIDRFAGRRVF